MENNSNYLHSDLSDKIISCFYKVYNNLGFGFLEKVYQKSLEIELKKNGLNIEVQHPIKVYYDKTIVGEYFADILVDSKIIIEIKAVDTLVKENEQQLINYLKSTDIELGLLLNFGRNPEMKRRIFTNDKKKLNNNNF